MAKPRVIIVGAGLFGSIAATLCKKAGHPVTVIDCHKPFAASPASGCVLAPSWLSSLSSAERERGMDVLRDLYTLHAEDFRTPLGVSFKAHRVDPQDILLPPDIEDEVVNVGDGEVLLRRGDRLRGRVLVAAGLWADKLVRMPKINGLYGASVTFHNAPRLEHPIIHTYLPYRQMVLYQMDKRRIWAGDGTALVESTWMKPGEGEKRCRATYQRALGAMKLKHDKGLRYTLNIGARPYVEGHKAGYFAQTHPRTWVSTGGAKNGTVLAALQASRFVAEAL